MKNIAVIGHDGKLGSELMKQPNTIAVPWMFENDHQVIAKWFNDNPAVDTVWHVARTCRKQGTRRDHETFLTEQKGMLDLMQTRAKHCRFVYASSKIVYGLGGVSDNKDEVLPVQKVAEHFYDDKVGIHNCPEWQTTRQLNINELDTKRTIYACTKLSNEQIIQKHCSNFKIIRIWDIA
jgi:nucleoside-diphosphate-sugar epimerase